MAIDEKMRICHLISGDLWAGAEVQMYTLVKSLCEVGSLEVSAIVLNEGILSSKLRALPIKVSVFEESKHGFRGLLQMVKDALDETKPQILHTHRYKENILGALAKKDKKASRLIQTIHGVDEKFKGLKRYKAYVYNRMNDHYTREYYDSIITVSEDIRNRVLGKFGSARLTTIHNSVDLAGLRPTRTQQSVKDEFGIDPACPVVGSVGRMVPVKGFDIFLKMADRVSRVMPEVKFVLVGDGPLLKALKALCSELGLAEKTIFTGFREDAINIVNIFDLFVVTSYHEGIPMSVLESMALGKAVVGTARGGMTEIIQQRQSGILVDSVDPEFLAKACLEVLQNRALKDTFGQGAINRIKTEFSLNIHLNRVLKLYRELVSPQ